MRDGKGRPGSSSEGLRDGSETGSLDAYLDSVPNEDEEISEAEVRVAEDDIRQNGTVSHEEAMRFLAS